MKLRLCQKWTYFYFRCPSSLSVNSLRRCFETPVEMQTSACWAFCLRNSGSRSKILEGTHYIFNIQTASGMQWKPSIVPRILSRHKQEQYSWEAYPNHWRRCTPVDIEYGGIFGEVFRDAYTNLELTSSIVFTAFSDYPPNIDKPPKMWTAPYYLSYLHYYAVDNDIFRQILFKSTVVGVKWIKGQGQKYEDSITGKMSNIRCCILVVCVGSNAKPSRPTFPGQIF
jgi:hypothetical protein